MHDSIYRANMLFKECANIEFDKLGSENSEFFRQINKATNIWNTKEDYGMVNGDLTT